MPKLNIKDLNNHPSFKEFFEFVIAFFLLFYYSKIDYFQEENG